VAREGSRHIAIAKGDIVITIARHDPVNACAMGGVIRDGGHDRGRIPQFL
jgi:hypothetical protein